MPLKVLELLELGLMNNANKEHEKSEGRTAVHVTNNVPIDITFLHS